jgi:hypothetical protein
MNERTLVTNQDDLVALFGKPRVDAQGFYAAREFLRRGNQLYIVRVGDPAYLAEAEDTAVDGSAVDSVTFKSITPGTDFNGILVNVVSPSDGSYAFAVEVETAEGILLERFDDLNRANVEAAINDVSEYITATVLTAGTPGEPATGQNLTLAGGNDGLPGTGLDPSYVIGTTGPTGKTGLKLFSNPDEIDLNLLAAPGFYEGSVIAELISIAESRADTLAIIDPPDWDLIDNVTDIVAWSHGSGTIPDSPAALNTSYAALFWPWCQVYDEYNSERVWIAPSGFVAGVMAYTDAQQASWFAPAGFRRGKLAAALGIRYSPDQGERNVLEGPGNSVNPIVNFVSDGIVVYGQKTTQVAPTALDRINVRRMLLFAEKTIASTVRYIEFEPNDPTTQREFRGLVEPVLREIMSRRGIRDFLVVCDASTNPPEVIDRNELRGKIFIKPTKSAEIIILDYILTSQGADFSELLETA